MIRFSRNAPPRYVRADRAARAFDRARAARGRHVPAVVSRHRAAAVGFARDGAAHAFALHGRLCGRPDRLRAAVRPLRPPPGAAGSTRHLLRGRARLRARAEHRDAARGALPARARLVGRDRARPRNRARPLFRGARGARIVADGRHHGARAGRRADDRRRAAERVRLALALRPADRVRPGRGTVRVAQIARDPEGPDRRTLLARRDPGRLCGDPAQPRGARLRGHAGDKLCRRVRLDFRLFLRAAGDLWALGAVLSGSPSGRRAPGISPAICWRRAS